MGEWLGDTPVFRATATEAELADFERFKTKVKATSNKEDTMAKKNVAQTTATESKEDTTMSENTTINTESIEGVPFKLTKNGGWYHKRVIDIQRHAAIRDTTKFGRTKGIKPTTCIPNETIENITRDEDEIALLGKACKKFGWKNGVCTPFKASINHGRPNPEYKGHGWLVWFEQEFYKTGERAGQPKKRGCTVAYPLEAFVWETESGLPEFDDTKPTRRRRANKKNNEPAKQQVIVETPVPAAAPTHKFHVVLDNGTEFWADTPEEVKEYRALFE